MHPDLYYVVHQQRERELEADLQRRLIAQDRVPVTAGDAPRHRRTAVDVLARLVPWARTVRPASIGGPVCCPA